MRDVINKVFYAIPESEKGEIINKWSSVRIEYGIRPADILKWILVLAGAAGKTETAVLVTDSSRILLKAIQDRKNLMFELRSLSMNEWPIWAGPWRLYPSSARAAESF